jgi:hypothetical protein
VIAGFDALYITSGYDMTIIGDEEFLDEPLTAFVFGT